MSARLVPAPLLAATLLLVGCASAAESARPAGTAPVSDGTSPPASTSPAALLDGSGVADAPAPGAGSPTSAGAPKTGAEPTRAGTPTTQTAPASRAGGAGALPASEVAVAVAAPGTYRWTDTVVRDGARSTSTVETIVVQLDGGGQRWTSSTDGRPSGVRELVWSGDQLVERSITIALPEGPQTCRWEPPLPLLRRSMSKDDRGTDVSRCRIDAPSLRGTITAQRDWQVGGRGTRVVDGASHQVAAHAVVTLRRVQGTAGGQPVDSTIQEARTELLALDLGVAVSSHIEATAAGEPGSTTDTVLAAHPR